jgi:alpha-glucosidase
VTAHLDDLRSLGVDAVWLSPFYRSPQHDAGYDVADYRDVDPLFGTLADFDEMLAAAHDRGIRVIVDLVPNHSSDQHVWFQEALAAEPGSAARARYLFRDGRGPRATSRRTTGSRCSAAPRGRARRTPTARPASGTCTCSTEPARLRLGEPRGAGGVPRHPALLARPGVDGFRVDVAHGLVKTDGLPDHLPPSTADSMGGDDDAPYWGQDGVHEIYRDWHRVLAEYDGDRALCAEAWLPTVDRTAEWVRSDEMHQAFNFPTS